VAHKFSQVVRWFLSQLFRQTGLLTLIGDSDAPLLFTLIPETWNRCDRKTGK